MRETALFREDMEALRIIPPDALRRRGRVHPGRSSTGWSSCSTAGAAYRLDDGTGDVYFDLTAAAPVRVRVAPGPGRDAGARRPSAAATPTGRASATRSTRCCGAAPATASRPGTAAPLGPGRPGWHIECAVIALDRLGTDHRRPGRRQRPALPAPRVLVGPRRGAHRRGTVRPSLRARRHDRLARGRRCRSRKGNLVFVSRLRGDGVDPMAHAAGPDQRAVPVRPAVDRRGAQGRPSSGWPCGGPRSPCRPGRTGRSWSRRSAAALRDDLDTPTALLAMDDWSEAALARTGTHTDAPALVTAGVDALLGIRL